MLAAATVTRLVLVIRDVHHPGIWCNTLARLDPIAGGALLACFLKATLPEHTARSRALWIGVGAMLLIGSGAMGRQRRMAGPGHVSSGGGRFGGHHLRDPWLPLAPRPLLRAGTYLGKISYGLYVFHAAVDPAGSLAAPGSAPNHGDGRALVSIPRVAVSSAQRPLRARLDKSCLKAVSGTETSRKRRSVRSPPARTPSASRSGPATARPSRPPAPPAPSAQRTSATPGCTGHTRRTPAP